MPNATLRLRLKPRVSAGAGAVAASTVTRVDSMKGGFVATSGATIDVTGLTFTSGDLLVWTSGSVKVSDAGPDYYPIPSGFTEITRRKAVDLYSTLTIAGYKISDGTETSLSVASGGTSGYNSGYTIFVFRNADLIDPVPAYEEALNTFDPPSVSVTPDINGSVVLVSGIIGNGTETRVADGNSDLTSFIAHTISDPPVGTSFFNWTGSGLITPATGLVSANLTQNGVDGFGDPLVDQVTYSAASLAIVIRPETLVAGDQLVLSGDMNFGTDQILLSGDMNSGTDILLPTTIY